MLLVFNELIKSGCPEMNDAAIAGAVIGALLCVAFIVLLVWFIAHHLKKKKYKAAKASE